MPVVTRSQTRKREEELRKSVLEKQAADKIPRVFLFANLTRKEYFVCHNKEQVKRFLEMFKMGNLNASNWRLGDDVIVVPNHLLEKVKSECTVISLSPKNTTEKKAPQPKEILVVNLMTEEYFICEDESQMKRFMNELFGYSKFGSHWQRADIIKIVPEHLNEYVKNKYAMLYMDEYMEKHGLYVKNHWERGESKELV